MIPGFQIAQAAFPTVSTSVLVFGQVSPALGSSSPNQQDRAWLGKYTLAVGATINSIAARSGNSTTVSALYKGLIFDASGVGGLPVNRLGVGSAVQQGLAGNISFSTLSAPLVLTAGDYWLGMVSNDTGGFSYTDSGGGSSGVTRAILLNSYSYASPPATAGVPTAVYDPLMGIAAYS